MIITKNFDSEEFNCHDGAPYPAKWRGTRLVELCGVLEVAREEAGGVPVKILSGYRSPMHNAAIGGAKASQHMEGRAADVTIKGMEPAEVHAMFLRLHEEGKIRLGGLGRYPHFTHVDVRPGVLRRWQGSRVHES